MRSVTSAESSISYSREMQLNIKVLKYVEEILCVGKLTTENFSQTLVKF